MQSLIQHRGWIRSFVTISVPSVDHHTTTVPVNPPHVRDLTLPALEHLQFAFHLNRSLVARSLAS